MTIVKNAISLHHYLTIKTKKMNQIDYWNEGIGTLIFIISIPVFVFAWVALACVKDIIIEKLKK